MCLYIHFCNTVIMYLAACFAAVSKWNVQRVALKHTFNTWPWHVFITLVQARIAVFSLCCLRYVLLPFIIQISGECRWRLSSMKLEVSLTPNPNLNLPESVNKCKSNIKRIRWCSHAILTSLCRFELFCWTVVWRDSYRSFSSPKCNAVSRELPSKLTELVNSYIWSCICDENVQSISFQIVQDVKIVLKS